ncbi:hypothetical protein [Maribacter sp. 2210JD10-5]|uniref:hypothetical protein n=1 Tax=Maribacter sp. 2210JD10-5 TaxID=3386272 RepID=UPI0039BCF256
MKRFTTLFAFVAACFFTQAQFVDRTNFRAGINGGIVVGDFSEAYSLTLGLDVYHHWGISKAIDIGVATGYMNSFGEKEGVLPSGGSIVTEDNFQFIPVGGSFRIYPAKKGFKFGADVGYAVGLNQGNNGGLYYRPSIGFDITRGTTEMNISYFAVNDEVTFSTALVGILILF